MPYAPAIAAVSCCRCGTAAETADGTVPLGWSTAPTPDGVDALCTACTREHVRDIEGKLDEAWWR